MGNVSDALKKHQAQQAAKSGPQLPASPPPAAQATTSAAVASPPSQHTAAAARRAATAEQPAVSLPACDLAQAEGYSPLLVAHFERDGMIAEQYRALRARLLARHNDGKFCLMITSALPGEGKTLTSANLALTLAGRRECTVVAVDCDFRRSRLCGLLNLPDSPGLADCLLGQMELEKVIRPTAYPNLFVVPAGTAKAQELGELPGHVGMEDLMLALRRKFDYVLVDTAPVNVVSDATALGRWVDEALLVVRMDRTRRESVETAIRTLNDVEVALAGIVLTHKRYYIPGYLYRYS